MTKIFIPSSGLNDWQKFLADPQKHWAKGYSARTLAHAWESTQGFPPEINTVLNQSPMLEGIEPLLIFPEWKVPLPGGSAASQNDIWVLSKCYQGQVSIVIEGKAEEPFDKKIGEWKANASKGKEVRLEYLTEILNISSPIPDEIYYQLLHRTASAVIEAERFGVTQAAMLIHSFSPQNSWFSEFKAFVAIFNHSIEIGDLVTVKARSNINLHLAWV